MQGDGGLVLQLLGLDGVAEFGGLVGPVDREGQTGEEIINYWRGVS